MVPDTMIDGIEAVYHPLSCVINKRFNSLEWNDNCMDLGLAEICTFPYPLPLINVECFYHNTSSKLCQRIATSYWLKLPYKSRLVLFGKLSPHPKLQVSVKILINKFILKENCSFTGLWLGGSSCQPILWRLKP